MNNKNTRKQKAKLIKGLITGKLTVDVLNPPQVYVFIEKSFNPGMYEMEGKTYTEREYKDFCQKIKQKENGSLIWNEGKTYSEDIIITVCSHDRKTIKDNK